MAVLPRLRPPADPVRAALRSNGRALVGVAIFSALINLLLLTSPLFMLQVYDRVLTSRSHQTLVALLGIATLLLVLMAILDQLRSSILIRIGLSLDRSLREHVFNGVIEQQLMRQTTGDGQQPVRDLDVGTDLPHRSRPDRPVRPAVDAVLCRHLLPAASDARRPCRRRRGDPGRPDGLGLLRGERADPAGGRARVAAQRLDRRRTAQCRSRCARSECWERSVRAGRKRIWRR